MCDVVTIESSDDDEPQILEGPQLQQPSVHVSIVNARPLDPFSLGPGAGNNSTSGSGWIDPEALRKALQDVTSPRKRLKFPISYKPKPSSSIPSYRNNHLSLMYNYNIKKRQQQAALRQAMRDRPPPPPKPIVPKIRYPSPPRTKPTGLEVDWRRRFNKAPSSSQGVIAPVDRYVTDARLKSYHFSAVGPVEPADVEFRKRRFPNLKFKCSFGGCRRIIVGDYHFVLHLWAHIVAFRECAEDSPCQPALRRKFRKIKAVVKHNDVDKLARCSECLTRFHFPIQMQIHYTKVHSRVPQALKLSSCMICEKDVGGGSEGLRKHLLIHSPEDAPFNCRVCKFRTTLRNDLLDHYIEAHGNTGTLMCPFCMYTHVIPGDRLNRALFIMSAFVQHMKDHAEKRRIQCDMCSCSFIDQQSLRQHEVDHMQIADNWVVTQGITPGIRSDIVDPREKCRECGLLPSRLMKKNEKCEHCMERYFWEEIRHRDAALAGTPEQAEKTVGGPIPAPRGSAFHCLCGMVTMDVRKLMNHYEDTQHYFKIVQKPVTPNPEPNPLIKKKLPPDELAEAQMFAVRFVNDPIQKNKDATEKASYRHRMTTANPYNFSEDHRFTRCKPEAVDDAVRFSRMVDLDEIMLETMFQEASDIQKTLNGDISDIESADEQTENEDNDDGVLGDSEQDDEQDDEEQEDEEQTEDEREEDEQEEGDEEEVEYEGMQAVGYVDGDDEDMHGMYEEDYDDRNGLETGESEVDEEQEEEEEEDMDMDQSENIIPPGLLTPESDDGESDGTI